MCVYLYVCVSICANVDIVGGHVDEPCLYVCTHVGMYACVYVCMYVCVYVCMYVCVYVCLNVCISGA